MMKTYTIYDDGKKYDYDYLCDTICYFSHFLYLWQQAYGRSVVLARCPLVTQVTLGGATGIFLVLWEFFNHHALSR